MDTLARILNRDNHLREQETIETERRDKWHRMTHKGSGIYLFENGKILLVENEIGDVDELPKRVIKSFACAHRKGQLVVKERAQL